LSIAVIIAGVASVFSGYSKVGAWSSLSTVVPAVVSGLLYKRLEQMEKSPKEIRK
jgi:hypothetical protein